MQYAHASDPAMDLIVSKLGPCVFGWGAFPLTQALSLIFTLPKYYSHISYFFFSLYNNWAFSFLLVFVLLAKCWGLLFSCLLISFSPKQIPRWFGFITLYVPPCHLFSPLAAASSSPSFFASCPSAACPESHGKYLTLKQSASLEYLLVAYDNFSLKCWDLYEHFVSLHHGWNQFSKLCILQNLQQHCMIKATNLSHQFLFSVTETFLFNHFV